MTELLRLNLGCGATHLEGYINCDQYKTEATDVTFNVQEPWPFEDNSVSHIVSIHMLEHLPDPRAFFQHAWNALVPNGTMHLQLPYGNSKAAWWDIQHLRPWYAESFCFLQPGYGRMINNPEHETCTHPFLVGMVSLRVSQKFARLCRFRLIRKLLLPQLHHLEDGFTEIIAELQALKMKDDIAMCEQNRQATRIPVRYVAFEHHIKGTKPTELSVPVVNIGDGILGVPGEF